MVKSTAVPLLDEIIKSKGLKVTGQRKQIAEYFCCSNRHFTPDELFIELRKEYPKIGRATVYRTLKLLKEADVARQIGFADGIKKYEHEYKRPHHDHMVCVDCGRVIEFFDSRLEKIQEEAARKNNFVSKRHRLEIYGTCSKCSK